MALDYWFGPYRARRFFHNLWWEISQLPWKWRNFKKLFPYIWKDSTNGDWNGLVWLMEIRLRDMAEHFAKHRIIKDWERIHRQTLVAAELCRRIMNDEYAWNAGYPHGYRIDFEECVNHKHEKVEPLPNGNYTVRIPSWEAVPKKKQRRIFDHAKYMQNQDVAYLGKLIGKYLLHWWD